MGMEMLKIKDAAQLLKKKKKQEKRLLFKKLIISALQINTL